MPCDAAMIVVMAGTSNFKLAQAAEMSRRGIVAATVPSEYECSMMALRHIATPVLLALLAGCGGAGDIAASSLLARGLATSGNVTGTIAAPSPKGTLQIPFRLLRPAGDGPFPAIVL